VDCESLCRRQRFLPLIYTKNDKLLTSEDSKLCNSCCSSTSTTTTTTATTTYETVSAGCGCNIPTPKYLLVVISGASQWEECDCHVDANCYSWNGSYITENTGGCHWVGWGPVISSGPLQYPLCTPPHSCQDLGESTENSYPIEVWNDGMPQIQWGGGMAGGYWGRLVGTVCNGHTENTKIDCQVLGCGTTYMGGVFAGCYGGNAYVSI
jgi:hypothetical protein